MPKRAQSRAWAEKCRRAGVDRHTNVCTLGHLQRVAHEAKAL
jgi:hypothetical protein